MLEHARALWDGHASIEDERSEVGKNCFQLGHRCSVIHTQDNFARWVLGQRIPRKARKCVDFAQLNVHERQGDFADAYVIVREIDRAVGLIEAHGCAQCSVPLANLGHISS